MLILLQTVEISCFGHNGKTLTHHSIGSGTIICSAFKQLCGSDSVVNPEIPRLGYYDITGYRSHINRSQDIAAAVSFALFKIVWMCNTKSMYIHGVVRLNIICCLCSNKYDHWGVEFLFSQYSLTRKS